MSSRNKARGNVMTMKPAMVTTKDLIIDDLKIAMGHEHNGIKCDICGYNHSAETIHIETREGDCLIRACEDCSYKIHRYAKFGDHGVHVYGREKIDV